MQLGSTGAQLGSASGLGSGVSGPAAVAELTILVRPEATLILVRPEATIIQVDA